VAPVSRGKDRRTKVGLVMRLSKDLWLLDLAFKIAERSTCTREKHGCVIARNGIIVATGYNGSPEGEPHCDEVGCDVRWEVKGDDPPAVLTGTMVAHCVRTIHSEINAIINAALVGTPIADCDWYITGVPCSSCMGAVLRTCPNRVFFCSDRGGVDSAGRQARLDKLRDSVDGWAMMSDELRKKGVQV